MREYKFNTMSVRINELKRRVTISPIQIKNSALTYLADNWLSAKFH